jgi:hypothetical protein
MITKRFILNILAVFVLLLSGCATWPVVGPNGIYSVEIDSIAAPDADLKNKTYVVLSAMKSVSDNDIQFKEFARYVENALSKTRYKRVDKIEHADLIIRMAYGIGDPKTETSTQVHTTSTGYSYPVGWTWIHVPSQTSKVVTKTTTYLRYLILEAYDSENKQSQLWKTTLKSEGSSGDLRTALPHMIAAAIFDFGTNTGHRIEKKMYQNAARVFGIMQYQQNVIPPFTGKERLGVYYGSLKHQDQLVYHGKKAGVLVLSVAENSVAEKMGIKRYDILLAVNNKIIENQQTLSSAIQGISPGGKIQLTFFSWDEIKDIVATDYLK